MAQDPKARPAAPTTTAEGEALGTVRVDPHPPAPTTDDPGVDSAIGTTHDPNSVTTGTPLEPDDKYPPKGERAADED